MAYFSATKQSRETLAENFEKLKAENDMLKKILNLILLIILLNILNSCQFSSLFHRANKLEKKWNFNNLPPFAINGEKHHIESDALESTICIFKDTVRLNKTYEIKPIDLLSKSGNK